MAQKEKIVMEFLINSSPQVLYDHISSPSGLSKWFADNVNINRSKYTFFWDGDGNEAELLKKVNGKYIRFKWLDSEDDEYFEMEVTKDDLTGDIALMVTDYADPEDIEETEMLWESQVQDLKSVLGVN
jgi:uncharacterized protein YndB with AHSA1/START domain